jgi:hypothetical protein
MRDYTDKDMAQDLCTGGDPRPGDIYRHYKGGLFTVVARAVKEDSLEPLVIYWSNASRQMWARTLDDWRSSVDTETEYVLPDGTTRMGRPRFSRVRD